jgi:hypothetical protein
MNCITATRDRLLVVGFCCFITTLNAAEDFNFDPAAFQKQAFEWGAYLELDLEHFSLNQDSAAYLINLANQTDHNQLDRTTGILELNGSYKKENLSAAFIMHSETQHDAIDNRDETKLYEATLTYQPDPATTIDIGKKSLRWGKGYAWNPVGFIERPKDPNDPDLSREGYVLASADFIRSRNGPLQTVAITPVILPVDDNVNDDFGEPDHINTALKLYLLYRDTDIDFMMLSDGSRSTHYGLDFSLNLDTNIELHGEWAHVSEVTKPVTDALGNTYLSTASANNYLLGVRYLSENETTYILEYFSNGAGYSESELADYYQLVHTADDTNNTTLLDLARDLGTKAYLRRNAGQQYLYLRVSHKEPFDLLYFTPAVTAITNLDDQSFSVAPEMIYTGFNNLEMRLKGTWLQGSKLTEFGEKQNDSRIEFRARYFF